jgi:phospholipid-transporting ATPase
LQDEVENTLESFIKNGIKVWMLTGDQKLTAKSIARSCKMITKEYEIIEVDEDSNSYQIKSKLNDGLTNLFFNNKKLSLIIGTDDLNCVFLNLELKELVIYILIFHLFK